MSVVAFAVTPFRSTCTPGCGPVCDPYELLAIATMYLPNKVDCSLDESEKVHTSIEFDRSEEMPEVKVLWKEIRPSCLINGLAHEDVCSNAILLYTTVFTCRVSSEGPMVA